MIVSGVLALAFGAAPLAVEVVCPDVDQTEVRRLVALELRRPIAEDAPARGRVECRGDRAELGVEEDGRSRQRSLDLSGTAAVARARLLALSLAELLTPSPADTPEAPAPVKPPAPAALVVAVSTDRREPLRAVALGRAQAFSGGFFTLGAGLKVAGALTGRLAWQLEASFDRGSSAASQGSVSLDAAGATAAVVARIHPGRWTLGAGPALRAVLFRMRGHPAAADAYAGRAATGISAGPALVVSAAPPLLGAFAMELSAEAGALLRPMVGYAGGARAAAVRGTWIGAALGVGLGL